jgi:hypothetical protein
VLLALTDTPPETLTTGFIDAHPFAKNAKDGASSLTVNRRAGLLYWLSPWDQLLVGQECPTHTNPASVGLL